MWGYSDVLWWLLINCVGHWQDVTKCDKMWQNVTKCDKNLGSRTMNCHKTSQGSDWKCHKPSEVGIIYHNLSQFITKRQNSSICCPVANE